MKKKDKDYFKKALESLKYFVESEDFKGAVKRAYPKKEMDAFIKLITAAKKKGK